MNQEITNVLNQGAPIFSGIKISLEDLLLIADDKELVKENIEKIHEWFYKRTHFTSKIAFHHIGEVNKESFESGKFEEDFITNIFINASATDSITRIYFDPKNYFVRIQEMLNMDNISDNYNDINVINNILNRIDELEKTDKYTDFTKNYPQLYLDYVKGNQLLRMINEIRYTDPARYEEMKERYFRCGLRYSMIDFKNKQCEILRDLVNNYHKVLEICASQRKKEKNADNTDYLDGINPIKLQFLIAYKYIQKAINSQETTDIQNAIFYILPILKSNDTKSTILYYNFELISYEYFKEYYKIFMKSDSKVVPYNVPRYKYEGKTKKESLEMLQSELSLLQKFKKDKKVKAVPYVSTGRHRVNTGKTEEELNAMYERKVNLLEPSNYVEKFITQYGYSGYIYFLYENGIILREKYFTNAENYTLAREGAMYKSDISNYHSIQNLANGILMYYPDEIVSRIYHAGNYECEAKEFMRKKVEEVKISDVEDFIYKERENGRLVPTRNKKIY